MKKIFLSLVFLIFLSGNVYSALEKSVETEFGINATYWKVTITNINWLENRGLMIYLIAYP